MGWLGGNMGWANGGIGKGGNDGRVVWNRFMMGKPLFLILRL